MGRQGAGRLLAAAVLVAGLAVPSVAHASPPGNDSWAGAARTFPSAPTADLTEATLEAGEPLPSCRPTGQTIDRSVWYRIDPSPSDPVQPGRPVTVVVTPAPDVGFSPVVAVYDLSAEVGCGTPILFGGSIGHWRTRVPVWQPASTPLYIQIVGEPMAENRRFSVTVSTTPGDDRRAPQIALPGTRYGTSFDLGTFSHSPGDPPVSCAPAAPNAWVQVETVNGGYSRLYATAYEVTDPHIAIFRVAADGLHEVACLAITGTQTDLVLAPATVYLVEVAGTPWIPGYHGSANFDLQTG